MWSEALQIVKQSHHDYYVRLHKEGKLTEDDRPQYDLAMRREKNGEVKPLEEKKD